MGSGGMVGPQNPSAAVCGVYLRLLLTAVLWGGTFVAARVAAREAGPFAGSFLRFFAACLILVPLVLRREGPRIRLRGRQVFWVILLGLTGVFGYNVFFFLGLQTVTAGRASLIVANNPVFIALFATLLFRERMTGGRLAGIFLSLAGAVVVITRGNPAEILHGGIGAGELYILGCVASWVAYSLIGKVAMDGMSPLLAVTASCVLGMLFLLPPAVAEGMLRQVPGYGWVTWMGIAYLGVFGTVLGFLWYYEGIRAIGPSRAGIFINFVPVSGVLLGWLLLGETVDLSLLVGAVLVVGGVALVNRTPPATRAGRPGLRETPGS
jgi:drug/metabolite transporter (DMT)-like permease